MVPGTDEEEGDKGCDQDENPEQKYMAEDRRNEQEAKQKELNAANRVEGQRQKAWDEYTGKHIGDFSSSDLLAVVAREAFKAGYSSGRRDENAELKGEPGDD